MIRKQTLLQKTFQAAKSLLVAIVGTTAILWVSGILLALAWNVSLATMFPLLFPVIGITQGTGLVMLLLLVRGITTATFSILFDK